MRRPWFPLYVDDWRTSGKVKRMTNQERGCYVELMCYQWEEGFVPDDLKELANICGEPLPAMRRMWRRLEPCFPKGGDGQRRNPRIEEERAKADRMSRNHSDGQHKRTDEEEGRRAYAFVSAGRIKIGISRNVEQRRSRLSTDLRAPVDVLGERPGSYDVERKAAAELVAYREEGEWYRDTPAVRQWLEANGLLSEPLSEPVSMPFAAPLGVTTTQVTGHRSQPTEQKPRLLPDETEKRDPVHVSGPLARFTRP